MAIRINLDHPHLGIQRDRSGPDAYLRNYLALKRYAQTNDFKDRLDRVLRRVGGDAIVGLEFDDDGNPILDPGQVSELMPRIRRAVDTAQSELKDVIRRSRKGVEPFVEPIRYRFVDKDGRDVYFELCPDEGAIRLLHKFESLIAQLPAAKEIEAQFLPAFKAIRREMDTRCAWDKQEAGPQATMLTIKQLCDTWSQDSNASTLDS